MRRRPVDRNGDGFNWYPKERKAEKMERKAILKKYPNRRLYNTATSSYVTLKEVAELIRSGTQVEVVDAKSGEDVTAFILTQIVLEQAKRSSSILPVSLLHLIIQFGENDLNEFFENYLEIALQGYLRHKRSMDEQFRNYLTLGMDFSRMARQTMQNFPFFKPLPVDPPEGEGGEN